MYKRQGQVLTSNGSSAVWSDISAGTSIYSTIAELPLAGAVGSLAYVTQNSTLYLFNGQQWISASPGTKNFFYIVQAGTFSGPIVGDAAYSPSRSITITSIEATLSQAPAGSVTFSLLKNGVSIQQFTIPSGQSLLEADVSSNNINTSDTVTMNVVSGSGQDLAVRFIYR